MVGLCRYCAYEQADCKGNKDLEKLVCSYYKKKPVMNIKQMAERVAELEAEVERLSNVHNLHSGDLISRADAIKAVEQEYKIDRRYTADDYTYGFNQAIQYVSDIILQDLPSADAVEVVRCKDCKNRARYAVCDYLGEDGYCSLGKSRGDGE